MRQSGAPLPSARAWTAVRTELSRISQLPPTRCFRYISGSQPSTENMRSVMPASTSWANSSGFLRAPPLPLVFIMMSGKPRSAASRTKDTMRGMERGLAAVVELDRAHPHVRALLEQASVEDGVHVAALVGVLVEALGADVLVGPDLAEALGVLLGAAAAQVAHRHRLDVDVDGMVRGVHVRLAPLPLAAVGLVALGAGGRLAQHAERRVLAHRTGKCSAGQRFAVSGRGEAAARRVTIHGRIERRLTSTRASGYPRRRGVRSRLPKSWKAEGRQVPHRRQDRLRGHGRRLSCPRPHAQPRRRGQDDGGALRVRRPARPALPPRGPVRGAPQPSQHRHRLRFRRASRAASTWPWSCSTGPTSRS